MSKVKGVLEELMNNQYGTNTHGSVLKELSGLLMKWNKMEKEEKNKQFNKNFCHELNIFLHFKDPEYF